MQEAEKISALDRSRQASEVCMPSFMRVLEVGEDNGLVYYTAHLNDGEFVHHYISRRGPLSPPTAFALVFQMLEDILQLRVRFPRLLEHLTLDQLLVGTLEDTFLQFRVIDYGLSKSESPRPTDAGRLVEEVCRLIFLLLTGVEYAGENPDRFPALTALPSSLRTTVRAALTSKENAPTSLEKLRDEVREAFSTLSSGPQGRNLRKHLVVIGPLQPLPQLQNLLLENVPVQTLFGSNFRVEDADQLRRYPFSIPALNAKTEQPVTVHMLPPTRLVDRTKYEAVPLQMWRFDPQRHPNILRSTSLWGYLMLRFLARLRPLRPRSLRYAQEHEALAAWLGAMQQVLPLSPALALAMAGLPQVLKGYGDTQLRGRQNYARLWSTLVAPALAGQLDVASAAERLQAALKATLADPEGKLNSAHQPGPSGRPVFWAATAPPRQRENTMTPAP